MDCNISGENREWYTFDWDLVHLVDLAAKDGRTD